MPMKIKVHASLIAALVAPALQAQVLDYSEKYKVEVSIHGERVFEQPISIGPGVDVVVRTEVTSKGNGAFHLKNLEVRNFDQHHDAAVFRDDALKTEFIDLDGDGYRDLVVSGAVIYTADRPESPQRSFVETVVWIFLYRRELDQFEPRYRNASFSLDLAGGPTTSRFYLDQGNWLPAKTPDRSEAEN